VESTGDFEKLILYIRRAKIFSVDLDVSLKESVNDISSKEQALNRFMVFVYLYYLSVIMKSYHSGVN